MARGHVIAKVPARGQNRLDPSWTARVCGQFLGTIVGRTFTFVPTHSSCGRSTGSVVAAVDVLPFSVGGLGLPAASRSREGVHWASWAD